VATGAGGDTSSAERDQWHRVLARVAQAGDSVVESTGTTPARRYLVEHWSDRAPTALLYPIKSSADVRLTVTATVDGQPVLIQVIDFWPPLPKVKPPVLFVLAARPLEPGGVEAALTAAGRELTGAGFSVHAGRAGVWAVRQAATAVLSDEDALHQVGQTLVDLTRQLPTGQAVPAPEPDRYADGSEPAMTAFLTALAAGDPIGALAYTGPTMFASSEVEPAPEDLDGPVDAARARPTRWHLVGRGQMTDGGRCEHMASAEFSEGRPGRLAVHLTLRGSRWLVAGYSARNEIVLGDSFPTA
jgi:hypothetical protein